MTVTIVEIHATPVDWAVLVHHGNATYVVARSPNTAFAEVVADALRDQLTESDIERLDSAL